MEWNFISLFQQCEGVKYPKKSCLRLQKDLYPNHVYDICSNDYKRFQEFII